MKMIRSSASEDNSIDVGDDGTSSLSSSDSLRRPSFRRHFFLYDTKMPIVNEHRLPAKVRDELRRLICLKCYDLVFKKDSMQVNEQREHDSYHGNAKKETISIVSQVCAAENESSKCDLWLLSHAPEYLS